MKIILVFHHKNVSRETNKNVSRETLFYYLTPSFENISYICDFIC